MSDLANKTPLSFPVTLKDDTVIATIGGGMNYHASLTPEQREKTHWVVASKMLNIALREPTYLKAATMSLQTACLLDGVLASHHPLNAD